MAKERIQKILAKAGIASRRKAEDLIREGVVTVNGKIASIGDSAEMGRDAIKVHGKLLHKTEVKIYLAFNKPRGVISMLGDPEGRPSLADFLNDVKSRVYPVGRLDFNSEGLILLTNDGEFAEALQKRDDIPRVYQVKVKGHPDAEMLARLERGGRIKRKMFKPHSVRIAQDLEKKTKVEIVFLGGGVDVRALFELKGFLFERITRTAIGQITLRDLMPGKFRYLTHSQIQALLDQPELGLKKIEQDAAADRPQGQRKFHLSKSAKEALALKKTGAAVLAPRSKR